MSQAASYHADVAIVGAGIAGVVCALELLDQGKRVLLLDRDTEAALGGLARESFGGLLLVDTPEQRKQGIHDSPERALADWLSFGAFGRDAQAEHWPRQWAEHYVYECRAQVYDWLKRQGVGFLPLPLWVERGQGAVQGNSVPRWHVVWGTGAELMAVLVARLAQHPQRARLQLACGHHVQELTRQDGRVTGCVGKILATGTGFTAQAEALVIAAGGVNGGDLQRARAHWPPDCGAPPASLLNGAHPYADGTLHRAAEAAGAALVNLQQQWNYAAGIRHWQPRKPNHGLSLVPPKSALWLDARGQRLQPPLVSGFDTRALVQQICLQSPGGYSWQVLNRAIALKELAISGAEFNPSIRRKSWWRFARDMALGNRWLYAQLTQHSSDVVVAQTVEELAAGMNALQGDKAVQASALKAQLLAYDAEVAKGAASTDAQRQQIAQLRQWKGDRLRTCKAAKILDARGGPLLAIREHIISRKSLGGIHTNLQSQALDTAGAPISGLYAIGEAAGFGGGGMNGMRGLEGTFLGGCIYSARRAAAALR